MSHRLLTRPFVLSWLANLAQSLSFFLFIHLPRYLTDLGASETQVGVIIATTAATSILMRPKVGADMDRLGRKPVILAGNVVNIVAMALYFTIDSLGWWLYVVRGLHGVAVALLFTSLFTYAADYVPSRMRTQGIALFGVSGMLPIALGGGLGEWVLSAGGFDALFATALGLATASLALSLPLPEAWIRPNAAGRPSMVSVAVAPALRPLFILTLIFATALTAYFTFLRTFVDVRGLGSVGGFFAAYAGVAISLRLVAGWLPDRVGPKLVLYPSLLVFAAGFVVLASAESDTAVIVAGGLCGAGHGYVFPILLSLLVERAPAEVRGSAMAVYTGLFDVGLLIGGPSLGWIIDAAGYSAMFTTAAGLLVVTTIVFGVWDRVRAPA